MDIKASAHRHGVAPADMLHAIARPVRVIDLDESSSMIVGAARNGALLEIGINADTEAIFHAMPARAKFLR